MEAAPAGFGVDMARVTPNETIRKVIRYDKKLGRKVEKTQVLHSCREVHSHYDEHGIVTMG